MYVRVEPSGCCERKGLVQVRFCMYLDKGDYGYNIHHIHLEESPGKRVWQTNPFHNHFIYVEPETTDVEIMDIGQAFLEEAYIKWSCDENLDLKNPSEKFNTFSDKVKVEAKVRHLKETVLERII